jgi:ABC-type phosphate transport system substrate-binding protein
MGTTPGWRALVRMAVVLAVGALCLDACMVPNGKPETSALVGSNATNGVMGAIVNQFNGNTAENTDPDTAVDIQAVPGEHGTVPADAFCESRSYSLAPGPGEMFTPEDEDAGRDQLQLSALNGDGCIDIARSLGPPRAIGTMDNQDLPSFEYYAYALDAVSWASASSHAPANLTRFQLQDIYNCSVTDWSAVGGTPGPIQRYWPLVSSTRNFFQFDVLGFEPTFFSNASCPSVIITEEASGVEIAANGDQATAIEPYLASSWVAEANGTTLDTRSGQTIRSVDGAAYVSSNGSTFALNTAGPVKESNVRLNNPTPTNVGVR